MRGSKPAIALVAATETQRMAGCATTLTQLRCRLSMGPPCQLGLQSRRWARLPLGAPFSVASHLNLRCALRGRFTAPAPPPLGGTTSRSAGEHASNPDIPPIPNPRADYRDRVVREMADSCNDDTAFDVYIAVGLLVSCIITYMLYILCQTAEATVTCKYDPDSVRVLECATDKRRC